MRFYVAVAVCCVAVTWDGNATNAVAVAVAVAVVADVAVTNAVGAVVTNERLQAALVAGWRRSVRERCRVPVACVLRCDIALQRILAARRSTLGLAKAQVDRRTDALQEGQSFGGELAALCNVLERADVLVEIVANLAVEVRHWCGLLSGRHLLWAARGGGLR